jgi:hypothetical protein
MTAPIASGFAKIDGRGRLTIGRYVAAEAGDQFRIDRQENGTLLLTPVPDAGQVSA